MEVDFATGDLAERNNSLVRSTSQDFNKVDASKVGKDGGNESDNSMLRDEKSKQLDGHEESAEVKKQAMKSSTEAEEDESDFEEEDVKVCDICGDAGREDLLAVCSRCTDGAEHTYCMRKMLDKVPEGDWFCEECELNEEVGKQGSGNSEILASKERNIWPSSDSIRKSDNSARAKADDNTLLKRIPNKRPADAVEVEPSTKRQTLQSLAASPSSPGSIAPQARDISVKSSGSFVKSNSFGTSSSNPKVSLVDENPQKHKKGVDVMDASRKLVGKSASFRGNINRSSAFESKVKMLSPEDSQILESRGLKQAKDRNILERKNSTKSDYSSCTQTVGNAGKHQARGEGKKNGPNIGGASSVNGINAGDAKADSVAIKEGLTSSSSRLEGSLTDHSERTSEKSYNNLREVVNAGSANKVCEPSRELSGNRRGSVLDSSLQRSSREVASEENKLKAAIQAAMQKKMDMDKKNKVSEKSNPVSVSPTDSVTETASGDKLPNLVNSLGSSSYCKEAFMNNSVQSKELLTDYCKERDSDFVSLNGEMILRRSVVPEREFIWQGSFEVHKHGTIKDQIAGFQAHLSSCGSSKVCEIARKFPQKVALDEVPRSCTWPTQFKDSGIDEDNIALYFFAEDYESYQRSYKYLLEKMMKDDLALRGTIDGVELLIFPSKHLTLSSQRWNMLFFLWGVFRGRRASNLDMKSANFKKHDICALNAFPQGKDVASSSLSPSNKTCLLQLEKENLAIGDSDHNVVSRCKASVPMEMPIHPSPVLSNGNCGSRGCSPDQSSLCRRTGSGHDDNRIEDRSESPITTRCESPCTIEHDADRKMVADCQTTLRKEVSIDNSLHSKVLLRSGDQDSQLHGQSFGNNSSQPGGDSSEEKNMDKDRPMELVSNLNKGQSSMGSAVNQYSVGRKYDIWKGGQILESLNHQDQAKPEIDADMSDLSHRNSLVHNFQQLFNGSNPNECSTISEARTNKGQKLPLSVDNNEERIRNRVARSSSFHGHDSSTGIDDAYNSVSENNSRSKPVSYPDSADSRTAEKFFFPVDSSHSLSVVSDSLRGRVSSSSSSSPGKDDRLAEGSPSLELALGVENKKLKSGFFFTSGERDQDKLEDARRAGDVEEEGTASLSLSLAFPFADRERAPRGLVEDQDAFPQKREASTSFLPFRGLPDK